MDLSTSRPTVFLATSDADVARAFYEGALGLSLLSDDPYALVYALNGLE
ncbi:MAG: VOC family protein, partial [Alphaproteobacteria bacterium]|nr:VOC family protein [Alphaproteobacteria bacterium]